jgi:hypothetical protein
VVSILALFPFFRLYQYWETHVQRCTFECLSGFHEDFLAWKIIFHLQWGL